MRARNPLVRIFETASFAIVELGADTRVVAANPHALAIVGSETSPIGRRFLELVSTRDPESTRRQLEGICSGEQGGATFECQLMRAGAEPRWLRAHAVHLADAVDDACAVVAFEDISDARRAEELLRNSYRFVESLIENIPDMIFVKDAGELRFVRLNRAGEKLLGYRRDELLGKNDYDFFPRAEADFFTRNDREVLGSRTLIDIPEEPIHTRALGVRWLHTKKIPILDEAGRPIFLLGISEDVTERREAAERLAEKTRELERSNAELERFAYAISHDLREPLRAISNFTDLLAENYAGDLDDAAQRYIRYAVEGARRMDDMITGLLQFSRIGAGYAPARVSLADVLMQVQFNLKSMIVSTRARIEVEPLPVAVADEGHLVLLFQNLISNAIKFRCPDRRPEVRVFARPDGERWVIGVRDNGAGIAKDEQRAAFEMFRRLGNASGIEGCGIGLAIVKKIVEALGGAIWIESHGDAGTTVAFSVPSSRVITDETLSSEGSPL
ncbi:MAG: PAS domain-containing protein [Myxococcales bacterium]|nr:PAS domain-containing protein [Myxococcales bacterium]